MTNLARGGFDSRPFDSDEQGTPRHSSASRAGLAVGSGTMDAALEGVRLPLGHQFQPASKSGDGMTAQPLSDTHDLLPCPFCGEPGQYFAAAEYEVDKDFYGCPSDVCGASPTCETAADWNTRAAETELKALKDIAAERARQIGEEGWTPEHDDQHDNGSLARAAACYAVAPLPIGSMEPFSGDTNPPSGGYKSLWPWSREWWKPKDRRRNLVRAAALLVAEIERIDRAAILKAQQGPQVSNTGGGG